MMADQVATKPKKTKDEDYNGLFMEAIDIDNQGEFVDLLIAKNCTKIVNCRDKSMKTIIVATDIVHDCIGDITRALSDQGALIIVGKDKEAIAVAISRIYELTDLCFDKHYDLPANVKHVTSIIYGISDLEIKAFVTSVKLLEQLHALISNQKYKEAVDLIKYQENINKIIIRKLCAQLTQKGNGYYKLMDFVYKLVQNKEKAIMNNFPLAFQWIFNGDKVRVLDKERKGTLWQGTHEPWHSMFLQCYKASDDHILFKLNPVWNTSLNSVMFEIHNPAIGKKIKLDPVPVGNIKHRIAWGWTTSESYGIYAWRLKPGVTENGEFTFCLVNIEYDSYLCHDSCGSYLIGIKETCTPDMGWIIDNPKIKS